MKHLAWNFVGLARREVMAGSLALVLAAAPHPGVAATLPADRVIAGWGRGAAHALVGKIWSSRDDRLVDAAELARNSQSGRVVIDALGLPEPTFVLVGEVHDNAQQHLLRAGIIAGLAHVASAGRSRGLAIASEHIDDERDEGPILRERLSPQNSTDFEAFYTALGQRSAGWLSDPVFEPLYRAIFEAGLPIYPGNVARSETSRLVRLGPGGVEPARRVRFGLDSALPPALKSALDDELKGSHCGLLPDRAVEGMASAQRYRDGRMAAAMSDAARAEGRALLLAGNGHVRGDRGVPWHLRRLHAGAGIVVIMMLEVVDGNEEPRSYFPRDPGGRPVADAIVFTPRAAREDPCAKMQPTMPRKG